MCAHKQEKEKKPTFTSLICMLRVYLCARVTSLSSPAPLSLIISASQWGRWFLWQPRSPHSQQRACGASLGFCWGVARVTGNAAGKAQLAKTVTVSM